MVGGRPLTDCPRNSATVRFSRKLSITPAEYYVLRKTSSSCAQHADEATFANFRAEVRQAGRELRHQRHGGCVHPATRAPGGGVRVVACTQGAGAAVREWRRALNAEAAFANRNRAGRRVFQPAGGMAQPVLHPPTYNIDCPQTTSPPTGVFFKQTGFLPPWTYQAHRREAPSITAVCRCSSRLRLDVATASD